MAITPPAEMPTRSGISRALSVLDRATARPLLGIIFITADGIWIVTSIFFGFPSALETIFQTLVAGLSFAMLFVIQHTQSRHQAATQRKLDEILLALPGARNAILSIENAADEELQTVAEIHIAAREEALRQQRETGVPDFSG